MIFTVIIQDFAVFSALCVQRLQKDWSGLHRLSTQSQGSGCLRTPPFLNAVSWLGQLNTSGPWGSWSPREPDGKPGSSRRALSQPGGETWSACILAGRCSPSHTVLLSTKIAEKLILDSQKVQVIQRQWHVYYICLNGTPNLITSSIWPEYGG